MTESEEDGQTELEPEGQNASATIVSTHTDLMKPFAFTAQVVEESIYEFSPDGIRTTGVDPANVAMYDLHVTPRAFDTYDFQAEDPFTIGVTNQIIADTLKSGAIVLGDDLKLSITPELVQSDFKTGAFRVIDDHQTIEPDAMRQKPSLPNIDHDYRMAVRTEIWNMVINHLSDLQCHQHIALAERDGQPMIRGITPDKDTARRETVPETRVFPDIEAEPLKDNPHEGAESELTLDYLADLAAGVDILGVDTIEVRWADEFPIEIQFEQEKNGETVFEGHQMLAPRIGKS